MKSNWLFTLALIVVFVFSAEVRAQEQKPAPSPEDVSEIVLNTRLVSAAGGQFNLSSYRKGVLVVALWATWCGPCLLQVEDLVKLDSEFRSKSVKIVALSTENPDASAEAVRRWVRTNKVKYQVGWAPNEVALSLMEQMSALPQVFVIRDGKILTRFIGYNREHTPREMRQRIEAALESP